MYRQWEQHGGSPWLLGLLLLLSSSALWTALAFVSCRMVFSGACLGISAALAQTLASTGSMCDRIMAVPGIGAPLRGLFDAMAMLQ